MTPEFLIGNITLFVLAIFLGFELITKVPATLHTPLMSGANAISGISIIGALLGANVAYEGGATAVSGILAFIAVVLAMINVVGGFTVTNRMLNMIAGKKRGGALRAGMDFTGLPPLRSFVHLRIEETWTPTYCPFWQSTWGLRYACRSCDDHSANGTWRWNRMGLDWIGSCTRIVDWFMDGNTS